MMTDGAKVLAGGAIAGMAACYLGYIVTRSRTKAARAAEAPGAPPAKVARRLSGDSRCNAAALCVPDTDGFELLGELVGLDEFFELARHCSARDAVRLSRCSSALHEQGHPVERFRWWWVGQDGPCLSRGSAAARPPLTPGAGYAGSRCAAPHTRGAAWPPKPPVRR